MNTDYMQFQKAQSHHLKEIYKIIQDAKTFQNQNNIHQWTNEKPALEDIKEDILKGDSFILQNTKTDEIIACAAVIIGEDPTYSSIYEGSWNTCSNGETYATIHRFAVSKEYTGKGFSKLFMDRIFHYLEELKIFNIRIDTHKDNVFMQKLIRNSGFTYCGIIYLADKSPRLAYDKRG